MAAGRTSITTWRPVVIVTGYTVARSHLVATVTGSAARITKAVNSPAITAAGATAVDKVAAMGVVKEVALATAGQAAAKPLVIATDTTYPPFEMVDSSGKLGGFEAELAYALCAAMKTECEVINQPWDALLPGLQVRKYDAIMSSMNITDERRQKVDFSQVYYMMQNRFVGRSDKAATFADDQAHFKGKVIAVQEGTPQDNFITARYGEVAKIKRYVNAQSPMLDLQSGRADYTFGNMVQLKVGFLDKEMGKQFAFVGPQFNGTQDKTLGEVP